MLKVKHILILSPLLALVLLIPINKAIQQSVIEPNALLSDSQGTLISLAIIAAGLVLGLIGVFGSAKVAWYFKLLIVALYIPVVVFSLLISGM